MHACMMFPLPKTSMLLAALLAGSDAHMLMKSPVPIGHGTINNSPVNNVRGVSHSSGGGDYPCKVSSPSEFTNAQVTNMEAGSIFTVSFLGSAVHGGGSCQFSLSTDLAPTSQSSFKVIHSVEGGCPARDTPRNLPGGAEEDDPFTYPVPIPKEIPVGRYTWSWTWINKIGNPEFYMNCAAIQITSTGSSSTITTNTTKTGAVSAQAANSFLSTLPDMVLINSDATECQDTRDPRGSFKYINPGASVERNEEPDPEFADQCLAGGGKLFMRAANPNPVPNGEVTQPAIPNTTASNLDTSPSTTSNTAPLTSFITINSPASFSTPPVTPVSSGGVTAPPAPTPTLTSTPPVTPVTSGVSAPAPLPTTTTPQGSCPTGQKLCTAIGFSCDTKLTFTNCAAVGVCGLIMDMAKGTNCVDNGIVFEVGAAKSRRRMRRSTRVMRIERAGLGVD